MDIKGFELVIEKFSQRLKDNMSVDQLNISRVPPSAYVRKYVFIKITKIFLIILLSLIVVQTVLLYNFGIIIGTDKNKNTIDYSITEPVIVSKGTVIYYFSSVYLQGNTLHLTAFNYLPELKADSKNVNPFYNTPVVGKSSMNLKIFYKGKEAVAYSKGFGDQTQISCIIPKIISGEEIHLSIYLSNTHLTDITLVSTANEKEFLENKLRTTIEDITFMVEIEKVANEYHLSTFAISKDEIDTSGIVSEYNNRIVYRGYSESDIYIEDVNGRRYYNTANTGENNENAVEASRNHYYTICVNEELENYDVVVPEIFYKNIRGEYKRVEGPFIISVDAK